MYHRDSQKLGFTFIWLKSSSLLFPTLYFSVNWATNIKSRASHFDSSNNLVNPWPFTSFMGLISKSYSFILEIHFPLLPSLCSTFANCLVENILHSDLWDIIYYVRMKYIEYNTSRLSPWNKPIFPLSSTWIFLSRKALLKNAMGCSYPSWFFYRSTIATMWVEENENIMKGFV